MTQEHPITPPEWLIEERSADWKYSFTDDAKFFARWGADQELEACCEWLINEGHEYEHVALRDARRPKPPSLKEQALELVDRIEKAESVWSMSELDIIRRALESLPS